MVKILRDTWNPACIPSPIDDTSPGDQDASYRKLFSVYSADGSSISVRGRGKRDSVSSRTGR
jgi:hypothetical protein